MSFNFVIPSSFVIRFVIRARQIRFSAALTVFAINIRRRSNAACFDVIALAFFETSSNATSPTSR
jgi:hypothetical protein